MAYTDTLGYDAQGKKKKNLGIGAPISVPANLQDPMLAGFANKPPAPVVVPPTEYNFGIGGPPVPASSLIPAAPIATPAQPVPAAAPDFAPGIVTGQNYYSGMPSNAVNTATAASPAAPVVSPATRKIVDAQGNVTYTNDPNQKGGTALTADNSRGTVSTVGDMRTQGMTPAQADAYWRSQSDAVDARYNADTNQRALNNSEISPTDSIGTIRAKQANRAGALKQAELGIQGMTAGAQGITAQSNAQNVASEIATRTGAETRAGISAPLANQAALLGIGKATLENQQTQQLADLYKEANNPNTAPDRRQQVLDTLDVYNKTAKYSPVMNKDEMGNQTYGGSFDTRTGKYVSGVTTTPAVTAKSDAQKAIATGKITKDEANKRLVAAGFSPL